MLLLLLTHLAVLLKLRHPLYISDISLGVLKSWNLPFDKDPWHLWSFPRWRGGVWGTHIWQWCEPQLVVSLLLNAFYNSWKEQQNLNWGVGGVNTGSGRAVGMAAESRDTIPVVVVFLWKVRKWSVEKQSWKTNSGSAALKNEHKPFWDISSLNLGGNPVWQCVPNHLSWSARGFSSLKRKPFPGFPWCPVVLLH